MTTTESAPERPPTVSEILRREFPEHQIGKLPRVTCGKCREARSKACDQHPKAECNVCGNWMTPAHIHLDYCGHAEVTDRLLEADPEWAWEPMAREIDPALLAALASGGGPVDPNLLRMVVENSPPKMERDGQGRPIGMWIRLTVGGVTRPGFGSVEPGKVEAEKQLVGDALRNSAMRFGVALSLWSKGRLESEEHQDDREAPSRLPTASSPARGRGGSAPATSEVAPPPFYEEYGYVDHDELTSVNESLRSMLDALPREMRGPIRQWAADHWYVAENDAGEVVVRPLPVRKADVEEFRQVLAQAKEIAQAEQDEPQSPTTAPETAPTAAKGAPGADARQPSDNGAVAPSPEALAKANQATAIMPPTVVDKALKQRKLPTTGPIEVRRERLAEAMAAGSGA